MLLISAVIKGMQTDLPKLMWSVSTMICTLQYFIILLCLMFNDFTCQLWGNVSELDGLKLLLCLQNNFR